MWGVKVMNKRCFWIILTSIYVCVGLYICFTPGYTYKATRLFYERNLNEIEDFIAYKEAKGFPKCEDLVVITLPDNRIEIWGDNDRNFYNYRDTTSVEYRNALTHLGVTPVQLDTLISKLKNIGVKGVYINCACTHFLLFHGRTYEVVKGNRLSRPLNDSEIGSRMQSVGEVRCNSYPFWWLLLYPYSNARNLNK